MESFQFLSLTITILLLCIIPKEPNVNSLKIGFISGSFPNIKQSERLSSQYISLFCKPIRSIKVGNNSLVSIGVLIVTPFANA